MQIFNYEINEILESCTSILPPAHLAVAVDILAILDKEGYVSSIYNKFPQSRATGTTSTHSILAKISLRDHSIHVARKFQAMVDHRQLLYPLGIIACLAHDIGKIPRICNQLPGEYTMTKHARAGAVAMERLIDGRLTTREALAVILAIRHHHDCNTNASPILDLLRRADCEARDDELIGLFRGEA
ncbi:HD domain-containing protein [Geobacter pelophilus]|uniref:HD domain-containing protein n=1 Tax=Geoanaerobacter pelophilus TaxID=60036 RepID=A0AAW4L6A6_9BACT|nr:HD domain-containing protein [Geoanaerobacter pelophilus]MBT0666433.1 HD domain-containing protein [Geoanaerobacter pelophilus]